MAVKNKPSANLFVYGSLRMACGHPLNQLIAQNADYLGHGWLQGRLYLIADYPGAILSHHPQQRVYGEIYQLRDSETVLTALDEYEECSYSYAEPHEYQRQALTINTANDQKIIAWTYLYNHAVSEESRIPSGDWLLELASKPELGRRN